MAGKRLRNNRRKVQKMTEKETFADLEKKLAMIDFSKELSEAEKDFAKRDFSDLERQLQSIDLDFLLQ